MATDHDWLVPELLERRDRFVLTGGEGSGKSYLLRQMGVAMASGFHPFDASTKIKPLKVLVVDAENTEQQWSRAAKYLTSVCTSLGSDPRSNVVVSAGTRLDFTRSADVNQVHKLLDVYKPDVLLIGPLYKLVPKEISTDDDAAPLIVALDGLRERGVTLLMEAHAGHAKGLGGERDLRPRGSSALLGWPEFGYGLQPVLGNEEMFKFQKWRGDRDARKWPTYLRKGFKGELPWMPTVNI
jgi:replicative DNA helicase